MRYLSGRWHKDIAMHPMGGLIGTPDSGNLLDRATVWAADNGRFNNPENYTNKRYLDWLAKQPGNCLFATAPDVVGDHDATLAMCLPMLKQLRREGRLAGFCAQDGATPDTVPWDDFDVLFIGGSTKWKLSGAVSNLCQAGKKRKCSIHIGRVNSFQRIKAITAIGADTCDGTFLAFGPDKNIPKLLAWLDEIYKQPVLAMNG
jgi:hypothetical protein